MYHHIYSFRYRKAQCVKSKDGSVKDKRGSLEKYSSRLSYELIYYFCRTHKRHGTHSWVCLANPKAPNDFYTIAEYKSVGSLSSENEK